ncbi:MAG: polyhydroxyalkanoate depolymerase [Rhodospirillales bacterium]|nr:polyhydroxyalkanoate depolymerase [Rhodospirillales bacterium]
MLYDFYQAQSVWLAPSRQFARSAARLLEGFGQAPAAVGVRRAAAWCEAYGHAATTHERPEFGIDAVVVDGSPQLVVEEVAAATPFARLLHFRKPGLTGRPQPRVLIVAPMSGHFATLLRGTVRTMLAEHDVWITDWINARDIALSAGRFELEDFTDHVIHFLGLIGPGVHALAVCQPAPAVLAAAALMAEDGHPATPRSLTLMAGPIDTRVNPTRVNELAQGHPIGWFERKMITSVPWPHAGVGRRVYPGFLQLGAFMSMNLDRHVAAQLSQFRALVRGDRDGAAAHRRFYGEYLAVMDLPGEFYLGTVRSVFQEHDLPLGTMTHRGRRVDLSAIRRTWLLTVEGELDDICSIGQTEAAQELCRRLPGARKRHHVQSGVGHYGVFNGRRWSREIYPLVREVIERAGPAR